MTIKERIQDEMKSAMKNKNMERLECLRMLKAAVMLKEKETGKAVSDEDAMTALRSEIRKRQQTIDVLREHGKEVETAATEREIAVIEEFLPRQLSAGELEARVRAYLADHPDINHAGKLTGILKKELGEAADGKVLNDVCRKVLGA
ncbi:MAG TPA: GatB/YqeY domain-containing protein [Candidatus Hydrogenedentes bacterium]|nr:GatB/YqeY domain-containing protein [Candidatus Hydrogenedentota bacterium]HQH53596.1 GatB/YqeY domain-containing protein [Candidatus Hydrogenedentota bacterium]HQM49887.1 GatB/YqeY domain-containing protein [Candidatus Hydrogenedentota bacterium]